jgi:hypothetical protein
LSLPGEDSPGDRDDVDWMLEIERVLIEKLHWSLYEMDRTDIESLIPFVFYLAGSKSEQKPKYADQVDWL